LITTPKSILNDINKNYQWKQKEAPKLPVEGNSYHCQSCQCQLANASAIADNAAMMPMAQCCQCQCCHVLLQMLLLYRLYTCTANKKIYLAAFGCNTIKHCIAALINTIRLYRNKRH